MSDFIVFLGEVPHNKGKFLSDVALRSGSSGGTVFVGRKISSNFLSNTLGFEGQMQDLILIVSPRESKEKIWTSLKDACFKNKKISGWLCVFPADTVIKSGTLEEKDENMEGEKMTEGKEILVSVILNKGFADDAMKEARKAGAGGGTVINARGTAREDDAKFFGVTIVPEKELLLMVVPKEKKEAVVGAIKSLPCLKDAGSGIVFCSSLESFSLLGKESD